MKKIIITIVIGISGMAAFAQSPANTKLSDLAVPASPAFVITDITPTLIQDPATPKSLVLGIAQSTVQQSGLAFPNNYSAEFAPYWWIKPDGRNVYGVLGINKQTGKEDPFAGLKFSRISIAFINKDLIPDTSSGNQKVFAIGLRTTLIKVHGKQWAANITKTIADWVTAAKGELDFTANADVQAAYVRASGNPDKQAQIIKDYNNSMTAASFAAINKLLLQKPTFTWDIAGAYSAYGINNQTISTGRNGAWTTLSYYQPLDKGNVNYFNIGGSVRYLVDNFQKDDAGVIGRANNLDVGGSAGFSFNQLTIGVESLYRYSKGVANTANRTVGVVNFKVAENIYVSGIFGKDFAGPNKIISAFGLNWGFGSEKVELPAGQ
ncbi:hypothetical protein [Mucilaginibacter phyllosphaerae]|uniref:Uncharacterized protein n=1 Tax=Mucilaginibacter phyllosphaerae TaxID=1812349 RepID=A0A4Y8A9M9_9SPHI|nr:hypothetical protein [Mucilaginibacter phyllosphaerae]MBB3969710.1 hypothetical protein [Mucilaginibacter phyllosphaerae]TEW65093.1 hypothetical protein E2R65_14350 [Mucilaginibacter phyllosphaerae]GGH18025.1 hypothetical protein GCM10007352_28470 [Mucilaginibacter phyllosphaerae]